MGGLGGWLALGTAGSTKRRRAAGAALHMCFLHCSQCQGRGSRYQAFYKGISA